MSNDLGLYKPSVNEPSLFTKDPGIINEVWVQFAANALVGAQVAKGRKAFDAINEFLNTRVILGPDGIPIGRREIDPRVSKFTNSPMAVAIRASGVAIQEGIRRDLGIAPPDFYKPPKSNVTADGYVALDWLLFICYNDGMTPEEAHAYAVALGAKE